MSYLIRYENLGRTKATGHAVIEDLSFKELNRVFKPFFFSELEYHVDLKEGKGMIYFGWYSAPFLISKVSEDELTEYLQCLSKIVETDKEYQEIINKNYKKKLRRNKRNKIN